MAKLSKSILIEAPVEKVFAYVTDSNNMTEYWPGILDVSDIKNFPGGGGSFKFAYKLAGIRLEAMSEDIEFVRNQRTVSQVKGGLNGKTSFTYESTGQGTKLTLEEEYDIPIPVLGKMAEAMVLKMAEHEREMVLANIKTRTEG